MDRNKYNGYNATSHLDMQQVVQDYYYKACKIPVEYQKLVDEIIESHLQSLGLALGNLELCYLRTKQHTEKRNKTNGNKIT
jgi:hypothetical protein